MQHKLTFGRHDYANCLGMAAYAGCSMAIPMCLVFIAKDLHFPLGEGGMGAGGALQLGRSMPMVVAMAACGVIAGMWGKRLSLGVALLLMCLGIAGAALAPSYGILFVALMAAGLGEGVIEGLATPFVQDLHAEEPGRYLNIVHSFWSIGVVGLVLLSGILLDAGVSWRMVVATAAAVCLLPVILFLWPSRKGAILPSREERVHWRDIAAKTRAIMKQPRFWLFFTAMFFAGGGEFSLTFWCASYIQLEFASSARAAGFGTACFAAGMIVGRIAFGLWVKQASLKKFLVAATFLAVLVCLPFPWLETRHLLFPLLFAAGLVAGPLWPSIQSDGAQRIPGDYTMMMILFSCAGIPGCGVFTSLMGLAGDWVGLRYSFLLVPASFALVFLLLAYDLRVEIRERKNTEQASCAL